MSISGASITFGLASWKMQGLHGNIKLTANYRPPFSPKMVATTFPVSPKDERQRHVIDFWPCIRENARVLRQH
jgi:hypothetical protein